MRQGTLLSFTLPGIVCHVVEIVIIDSSNVASYSLKQINKPACVFPARRTQQQYGGADQETAYSAGAHEEPDQPPHADHEPQRGTVQTPGSTGSPGTAAPWSPWQRSTGLQPHDGAPRFRPARYGEDFCCHCFVFSRLLGDWFCFIFTHYCGLLFKMLTSHCFSVFCVCAVFVVE